MNYEQMLEDLRTCLLYAIKKEIAVYKEQISEETWEDFNAICWEVISIEAQLRMQQRRKK